MVAGGQHDGGLDGQIDGEHGERGPDQPQCAALALLALNTGRFDAFLLAQRKYGNGLHNPFATFATLANTSTATDNTTGQLEALGRTTATAATELWFSTALVLVTLAVVAGLAIERRASPLVWAFGGYALLALVIPLVLGVHVAQYRSHALLVPAVLVLRQAPAWVTTGLLGAAALLMPGVTELVLAGNLI
jgi:hypothetical protein